MHKWKFNDAEFDFDPADADEAARYEAATEAFERDAKVIIDRGENDKLSDTIRRYCQLHFNLFDTLLGEGASEAIFKGVCNARLCDEAYESLIDYVYACGAKLTEERDSFMAKYKPRSSRKSRK